MIYLAHTARSGHMILSSNFINLMKIFRVLGLGLAIIMIRFLMPNVFRAFEGTLLAFFDAIGFVLERAQDLQNTASIIQLLPQ
jgi:cell shape-determining protein MreC